MGLFNTVHIQQACPACGQLVGRELQFKYGETRQHSYQVGDALKWGGSDYKYKHPRAQRQVLNSGAWGGNDVGEPGHKVVVVDAMSSACPNCGADGDYEVLIEDNKIVFAQPASGRYDFSPNNETYLVLEP